MLQCDRAKSLLRNAESRKRRVATPLPLPQPKAGMHRGAGRDIVRPGCSDARAAPQPRAPPAPTHSLLRPSFTERKSTVELRCRKNVSQGRAPHTVVVHPAMTKLHTGLCLLSTQNLKHAVAKGVMPRLISCSSLSPTSLCTKEHPFLSLKSQRSLIMRLSSECLRTQHFREQRELRLQEHMQESKYHFGLISQG